MALPPLRRTFALSLNAVVVNSHPTNRVMLRRGASEAQLAPESASSVRHVEMADHCLYRSSGRTDETSGRMNRSWHDFRSETGSYRRRGVVRRRGARPCAGCKRLAGRARADTSWRRRTGGPSGRCRRGSRQPLLRLRAATRGRVRSARGLFLAAWRDDDLDMAYRPPALRGPSLRRRPAGEGAAGLVSPQYHKKRVKTIPITHCDDCW
jgi:hypothetical protein